MRAWLLFPLLFWGWADVSPAGEVPLTPAEAQAAVKRAKSVPAPAGFWQAEEKTENKRSTTTIVTTEWREADRPVLRRTVREVRSKSDGKLKSRSVRLKNPEGSWIVYPSLAVRMPDLLPSETAQKALTESMTAAKHDLEKLKSEGRAGDPAARAELAQKYLKYSGVRVTEPDGSTRLQVRAEFGPEGVKLMRTIADEAWRQQKKKMSWGMRLLAGSMYAMKRDDFLPVAQETVIDEASGTIVEQTSFNASGKPIQAPGRRAKKASSWQPVEPLPPSAFEVPAGLPRHQAESLSELLELEKKHGREKGSDDEAAADADSADEETEVEAPAKL